MKIAVRGGHNFEATGSKGILDETVEDRKVKDAVIKYLRQSGENVLDVTPGNCDENTDLRLGVNKANDWGADLFLSIHFDNAYKHYDGALGTGTWIYAEGGQAGVYARRIVDQVASLGFKNRGVKTNPKLYELRKTPCPAVIVETCFVEATKDVEVYNRVGADAIGKKIAEGVLNRSINPSNPAPEGKDLYFRVIAGSFKDRGNAERECEKLKKEGYSAFLEAFYK